MAGITGYASSDPIEDRADLVDLVLAPDETVDVPAGKTWVVSVAGTVNSGRPPVYLEGGGQTVPFATTIDGNSGKGSVSADLTLHESQSLRAYAGVSASRGVVVTGYEVDMP